MPRLWGVARASVPGVGWVAAPYVVEFSGGGDVVEGVLAGGGLRLRVGGVVFRFVSGGRVRVELRGAVDGLVIGDGVAGVDDGSVLDLGVVVGRLAEGLGRCIPCCGGDVVAERGGDWLRLGLRGAWLVFSRRAPAAGLRVEAPGGLVRMGSVVETVEAGGWWLEGLEAPGGFEELLELVDRVASWGCGGGSRVGLVGVARGAPRSGLGLGPMLLYDRLALAAGGGVEAAAVPLRLWRLGLVSGDGVLYPLDVGGGRVEASLDGLPAGEALAELELGDGAWVRVSLSPVEAPVTRVEAEPPPCRLEEGLALHLPLARTRSLVLAPPPICVRGGDAGLEKTGAVGRGPARAPLEGFSAG